MFSTVAQKGASWAPVATALMGLKRARMDGGDMGSRPGAINVQTANFTRCNVKKRRRISKQKFVNKVVTAAYNPYVLRCNGVNSYASIVGGYFRLANSANTGNVNDVGNYLPIWYFDVTAAINWTAPAGGSSALTYGQVAYRPYLRTGGLPFATSITFRKNVTQFQNAAGAATGGNTNQLVFTPNSFATTNNGFLKAALHKWMSAKILCYGIYDVPVRFRVSLIRFHKSFLCPGWEDNGFDQVPENAGIDGNANLCYALQQYLAGPFRFSPLNEQQTDLKKHFTEKVLKDFVLGGVPRPAAGSAVPYMHQLNVFEQFNQIRRYDWNTAIADIGDPSRTAEAYEPVQNKMQPNVDFTKRWYLTIRAQSLAGTTADPVDPVQDTSLWPSFDLLLKNKYVDIP